MILTSVALQNFRNYQKAQFQFSEDTTLIIGPNTTGKTNILEAIVLCATGKSFRAERDSEVIRWGQEVTHITAEVAPHHAVQGSPQLQDELTKLEIVVTTGLVGGQKAPPKKYLVNGIPRRMLDFVGNLRVVLFWPEDLELVTDSPSLRRKYLDTVLMQVDREYRRNLASYERGLRQRNRLLDVINEGKASRSQLLFWNQLLIKAGGYLTNKRAEFIDFINMYRASRIVYHVIYDKSIISESRLTQYTSEEIAAKATLVGPHRDDFHILMQEKSRESEEEQDLSRFGSRGEQRLAVLWLKLCELAYIEHETGERPILLLDDIFSELDVEHRKLVSSILGKQQTVITSTDVHGIPKEYIRGMTIISLI